MSTEQLKNLYPGKDYHASYRDLKRFFEDHGFQHRQGSGYLSEGKMSTADVYDLMDDIKQEFSWMGPCVSKIDVTNVGRQHDLVNLLQESEITIDEESLLN